MDTVSFCPLLFIPVTFCPQPPMYTTPQWGTPGLVQTINEKMIYFIDEVRTLILLSRSIQLYVEFFAYIILKLKTKYSQKKHVEVRFFTVRTNPTPNSANMGWGVSEQCWMYQIFCGVSLNSRTSPTLFVVCSNKPHLDIC